MAPFYVEGKGWIPAGELKAGDKVQLYSGKIAVVKKVKEELLSKPIKVYNFEVADWHTYYVTKSNVLVHNACHGNSKNSTNSQHGYEIYEKSGGDVVKTGISGGALNSDGTSKRAGTQVRRLNRQAGYDKYDTRVVVKNLPGRQTALAWERLNTTRLFNGGNSMSINRLPLPY